MEIYGRVRRAVRVEGRSQRAVAREFGLSRETVRKMLRYAVPPGYQRQQPIKRPKLGPWVGVIDAILEDDRQRPAKQRHTAKRIFERLKEEHVFTGGYTIVKDYVRSRTSRNTSLPKPVLTAYPLSFWAKQSMWHSPRQNRRHATRSFRNVSRTGLYPDFFLRGCSTPISQSR